MNSKVDHIQWILDGFRLLIFADKDLILYQHKVLSCAVNINRSGSNSGNVKFTLNPAEDVLKIQINHFPPIYIFHRSAYGNLFGARN